jgi:hypothetical protein
MKLGGVVVVTGILAAAAGAFVGSQLGDGGDGADAARLTAEAQRLREENADLGAEVARLRKAVAEAGPALRPGESPVATPPSPPPTEPGAPVAPPTPPSAAEPAGPRFVYAGQEAVLRDIDWEEVGANMHAMLPLLSAFLKGLSEGKELTDMPEIGRLQQYNGPLVTVALKAMGKVPGRGPNGAFTHPYLQVNAIAATLDAAGMPLTAAQAAALERVGREHAEADERRRGAYDERTQDLQEILEEADARDRFFEAAFAVLSPAQHDLLRPAATRGRLQGDLFSSGIVWSQYARPMTFSDRATLVALMEQTVVTTFAIPESRRADARAAVEAWADGWPPEVLGEPADALSRDFMMMRAERVREAAARQLALQRRLIENLGLDEASAKKIRDHDRVHVPLPQS